MKAIIEGLRYDTEKATEVASANSGHHSQDPVWWEETLYKTRKGNWFLHGEGGARSKYGETSGQYCNPGSRILPLTDEDAFEWMERHGEVDALETLMGEEIEDA